MLLPLLQTQDTEEQGDADPNSRPQKIPQTSASTAIASLNLCGHNQYFAVKNFILYS